MPITLNTYKNTINPPNCCRVIRTYVSVCKVTSQAPAIFFLKSGVQAGH